MPTFLSNSTYERLLADLTGAFMAAATNTGVDLNDKLVEALCCADVMPDYCREDSERVSA